MRAGTRLGQLRALLLHRPLRTLTYSPGRRHWLNFFFFSHRKGKIPFNSCLLTAFVNFCFHLKYLDIVTEVGGKGCSILSLYHVSDWKRAPSLRANHFLSIELHWGRSRAEEILGNRRVSRRPLGWIPLERQAREANGVLYL